MIEIEQVAFSGLASKLLSEIDPKKYYYQPDSIDDKCLFLEEGFANFNVVQFSGSNIFRILLATEVAKNSSPGLHNGHAWCAIGANNLKLLKRECKPQKFKESCVSVQDYIFEINPTKNWGQLQFCCIAELARHENRMYKRGEIMQVSIYRNQKCKHLEPPTTMVGVPDWFKLLVPMLPMHKLQILMPPRAKISFKSKCLEVIDRITTATPAGKINSVTIICHQQVVKDESIPIFLGNRHQASITVPKIYVDTENDVYALVNRPKTKTHIISKNLDGLLIANPYTPNWLCEDDDIVLPVKDGKGMLVKFTKEKPSVSLEIERQCWLLSASQVYATGNQI